MTPGRRQALVWAWSVICAACVAWTARQFGAPEYVAMPLAAVTNGLSWVSGYFAILRDTKQWRSSSGSPDGKG